jgi:hypothetical protein
MRTVPVVPPAISAVFPHPAVEKGKRAAAAKRVAPIESG